MQGGIATVQRVLPAAPIWTLTTATKIKAKQRMDGIYNTITKSYPARKEELIDED